AEQGPHFADDHQSGILHGGDGVEVLSVVVVEAVADILPALPTVVGFQQRAVGPNGQAVLAIFEPDIQQRCFTLEILELFLPGGTAITGGENLRIMSDNPAIVVVDKGSGGEKLTG